jgi:MYXO-CTERM domain-containing protein
MRLAIVFAGILAWHSAHACSLIGNSQLQIDPQEQAVDRQAPTAGVVKSAQFNIAGCDVPSVLIVELDPGSDDRTRSDELGYELQIVSGALPEGFALPTRPLVAIDDKLFVYGSAGDPRYSVSLRVVSVDRAGNRSAASAPISISGEVPHAGGCSASGSSPAGDGAIAALLLFALYRRLRPRRA